MKFLLLPILGLLILSPIQGQTQTKIQKTRGEPIINDSLVTNLRCNFIPNQWAVFNYINKEKAFSSERHIPVNNWSFRSGPATLGGCWSLSRTQRLLFYLTRFGEAEATTVNQDQIRNMLNLIRGSIPVEKISHDPRNGSHNPWIQDKVEFTNYQVLKTSDKDLLESFSKHVFHKTGLWSELVKPRKMQFKNTPEVLRGFQADIEEYQGDRFYRGKNLGMAIGSSTGEPAENYLLAMKLVSNLQFNRLPLINIRAGRTEQHVVLLKKFRFELNGDITFTVYDSNQPRKTNAEVVYIAKTGKFLAPNIISNFVDVGFYREVAIFNVDDEEISAIAQTLFKYYKNLCNLGR